MRVALYARVSTTEQDTAGQLVDLRSAAAARQWVVIDEYVDVGVSGIRERRSELDRLLRDAAAGRFDCVFVAKLDRLGRSLSHLLRMLSDLEAQGVAFASLRDPGIDTTTPTGRLLFQLMGAFAEFERNLIRERVQAGVDRARAAGKHCGRPRRVLDLRAALLLVERGHSVRQVAEMLGVPRTTLARALAGPEVSGAAERRNVPSAGPESRPAG